jgi:hypothetical protein
MDSISSISSKDLMKSIHRALNSSRMIRKVQKEIKGLVKVPLTIEV